MTRDDESRGVYIPQLTLPQKHSACQRALQKLGTGVLSLFLESQCFEKGEPPSLFSAFVIITITLKVIIFVKRRISFLKFGYGLRDSGLQNM